MKTKLGLDIGSHSIKMIELLKNGSIFSVVSAGSVATPPKSLASNLPADQQALSQAIKQLIKQTNAKSRDVIIALPESLVFTRVIEVQQLSERELSSAIRWEAEQYVPLPLDQVNLDFTILRDSHETGSGKMEVLLVASPKALIEKYLAILDHADLNTEVAETEIISASRALVRTVANVKTAMVVSLGAQTTDLAILRNGTIAFTRSISAGGEALSRALVQSLDFNQIQAEQFKQTYGLEKNQLEGKILSAIKPIMDTIISEIKRAIMFYQEKANNERVEVILITGGTARLPGMVMYIAEATGIEVQLGNPWLGIQREQRFMVLDQEGPTYCVAIGLALRQ
jgi:type IV pilus assembly protein PilM